MSGNPADRTTATGARSTEKHILVICLHSPGADLLFALSKGKGWRVLEDVTLEHPKRVLDIDRTLAFDTEAAISGHCQTILQGFVQHAIHDRAQEAQPQTLAHALSDSPAGQLAWVGQLLAALPDPDTILTIATIYWLTNTSASTARFYYENHHEPQETEPTTFPIGLASFAYDFRPLRRFAERDHKNIVHWREYDRGGHWAAHDAPDLLLNDVREFFRGLRDRSAG